MSASEVHVDVPEGQKDGEELIARGDEQNSPKQQRNGVDEGIRQSAGQEEKNIDSNKSEKEKENLVKYMSNGNKTKLMTSGLLNTAALSTNASLLALIMKLDRMNTIASLSVCLIILSVTLQLMTAIFTLLEYRAMLIVDKNPEKLWQRRTLKRKTSKYENKTGDKGEIVESDVSVITKLSSEQYPGETDKTSSYFFCKPMELHFLTALCTVILTTVNTFIIALTSNIQDLGQSPEGNSAGTPDYQNNI